MRRDLSILYVDDEETAVKLGKEMLEEVGYKVTILTCGKKALEAFRRNPQEYDLVITDYNMPDLNGDQLAIKLRSIRNNIPIILCTGCRNITEVKLRIWGVNELILKPYQLEDIDALIKKVLNHHF